MAEVNTRGLASGFAQGFGLADDYFRGQAQERRQEEQAAMQREQFDMEKEEVERARDLEDVQFALGKIARGMAPSENEIETLRRNPKYWPALDPDTDEALSKADRVMDPESPDDVNDPDALASINHLFGTEINKGEGGRKMITGIYPGPDGESVAMDLDVTDEEGNTYRAPMTDGRSNREDDDLVKQVPVGDLVQQTQGMKALRKAFQSPEAQKQASEVLSLLRGDTDDQWEMVEGPGGSVLQRNEATGEIKRVLDREGSGSNYWSRPTSTQKDIEYMVDKGLADNRQEAWDELNQSRGDDFRRDELHLRQLNQRIEEIDDIRNDSSAWRRLGEDRRQEIESERDALKDERDALSSRMFDDSSGSGMSGPGEGGDRGGDRSDSDSESDGDDERRRSRERDREQDQEEPSRERGQRPGPSPDEEADKLLKDILG